MNRTKKKKAKLGRRQRNFILMGLVPICILFFVFSVLPIGYSIVLSFYNHSGFGNAPFVGFNNYIQLFKDEVFLKALKNTIVFVMAAANINLVLAMFVAVVIKSVKKRSIRSFFRGWFFLPAVIPIVAVSYVWVLMYQPSAGIINRFLSLLGISPVNWLGDSPYAMMAIIITTLWCDLGYNIILFLAGLDDIPAQFMEAAAIDGAGKIQQFFRITLPLMMRTVVFVSVTTYISYFQVFAQVQIMTKGGPNNDTNVLAYNIYNYAFKFSQMGYASAMAVILLAIILVISAIQYFGLKVDWEY